MVNAGDVRSWLHGWVTGEGNDSDDNNDKPQHKPQRKHGQVDDVALQYSMRAERGRTSPPSATHDSPHFPISPAGLDFL